jgi:hypothetical protein
MMRVVAALKEPIGSRDRPARKERRRAIGAEIANHNVRLEIALRDLVDPLMSYTFRLKLVYVATF